MSNDNYYGQPIDYVIPSFPSLYQPFHTPIYLYAPFQIWKFTLLWTLILFGFLFLSSGAFYLMFTKRHLRLSILAFLFYIVYGLGAALISSTIVGYAIAAIYEAAFLRMNTFIPLLWAAIQTFVILSTSLRSFKSMM